LPLDPFAFLRMFRRDRSQGRAARSWFALAPAVLLVGLVGASSAVPSAAAA
jgi:hypothetical protein